MAKPLGPKSLLIRQAIIAHPDKGNTELAEMLMDSADRLDDKP
jgi:peptide subunit release factor RF-3